MAPINGAASKPAKTTARRTASKVVPVLPLNYPQRPATKQPSTPPKSSPLAEVQPHPQVAEKQEDKLAEVEPRRAEDRLHPEDTNNKHDLVPAENGIVGTLPVAAAETNATQEEPLAPIAPSGTLSTGMILIFTFPPH